MRKISIFVAVTILLSACSVGDWNEESNTSDKMQEDKKETMVSTNKSEENIVETIEADKNTSEENINKRTVAIGENKPWEYATPDLIEEWLDNGEKVHLITDAEALEKGFLKDINDDEHAKEYGKGWNNYISLFVRELKDDNPEAADYLLAIEAAGKLAASGDLEAAERKIEEARKLRTQ